MTRTEITLRAAYPTHESAIAELVACERDLMTWDAFERELVRILWPTAADVPEGCRTLGQLLEAVRGRVKA